MKKQLITLIAMLLPMLASADAVEIDGIYYNLVAKAKQAEVTQNPSNYSGDITIPESFIYDGVTYDVTSIGDGAFWGCRGLTSVTIPNSVKSIGDYTFNNCSGLTSIDIPNSVTSIGDNAFRSCSGLTSIEIPNSVTSIGESAFYGCSGLTSVEIPNSVTSIGDWAFYNCSGLTSITIPNSVTSIGSCAFAGCRGLTSVTIPNSVKSIGDYTFTNCSGLTSVTIPNSVTSIGNYAFQYCSSLTSVTIPNSVTRIGSYAFNNCSGLTSVTIPNSVTRIGSYAFNNCSGLTSVTFHCKEIGSWFSNTSIQEVVIGDEVTSIGDRAFYGCSGLTSVTIPNSVTSIGGNAFDGVDIPTVISLIENPFKITGKTSNSRTFSQNTFNNATLYVPKGTIDKYKATEGWKDFLFIEEGTGGGGTTPEKCATPVISYKDGKLSFSCDTEGVEYVTSVECLDNKTFYDNEIQLSGKYKVSVYATKSGYEDSDMATAEIDVRGVKGDVNGDGEVNVTDIVATVNIIMSGENN